MTDIDLEELRNEYLETVQEDITAIEADLLKIESAPGEHGLREVFRLVHSIKGGAGSYGLNSLTAICHRFEDHLSNFSNKDLTGEFVDACLAYVDMLKTCTNDYKEGKKDLEKYITYLDAVDEKTESSLARVLLVEPTKSIAKIFREICQSLDIDISVTDNGAEAFNRLLAERYDAIFTSMNVNVLDGFSLISALKVTKNLNAKIPAILISSDDTIIDQQKGPFSPDHYIIKDRNFLYSTKQLVEKLFKGNSEEIDNVNQIIYVEDDPMIQKLVRHIFEKKESVQCEFATNLETTALLLAEIDKPDILLMDNYLEGIKGEEILQELALRGELEGIPVVMVTASPEHLNEDKLKKFCDYRGVISKPINVKTLIKDIKGVLK